jgi:hypothetical protein
MHQDVFRIPSDRPCAKAMPEFMQQGHDFRGQRISIVRPHVQQSRCAHACWPAISINFEDSRHDRKKRALRIDGDRPVGTIALHDPRHVGIPEQSQWTQVSALANVFLPVKIQFIAQRSKRCRWIRIFRTEPRAAPIFCSQDFENFFTCPQDFLPGLSHRFQIRLHPILGLLALRPGAVCRLAWFPCQRRRGERGARRRCVTGYFGIGTRDCKAFRSPGATFRSGRQTGKKEGSAGAFPGRSGLRESNCNFAGNKPEHQKGGGNFNSNAPLSEIHFVFSRPDLQPPQSVLKGDRRPPAGCSSKTVDPRSGTIRRDEVSCAKPSQTFLERIMERK